MQMQRMVVTCPVIAANEAVGELPGPQSKLEPWCRPILEALHKHASSEGIDGLIREGLLEIVPLVYMQGRTFEDTWIIADGMQNSTADSMFLLLTRLGRGSKLVSKLLALGVLSCVAPNFLCLCVGANTTGVCVCICVYARV
jgi:phosphate starvation-inducible PhoH-like protein